MNDDRSVAVTRLWDAHLGTPFPGRLRSVDVAGVTMVLLDADVAGCVTTWLDNGGTLDERRWDTLATCELHLERVLPELSGAEAAYFQRLHDMAVLVLESPPTA
ncbi:hypothetical protein JIG36_34590 [Actinoplanes sp. LDG1-06]|uniref:Uncharacterized protein n=1 Tax=Paractinoplanes ovalisporus TaxID=2810368 RepID=A0ABS2ALG8_9ACTN|nr:hypothetical protein [Actinoplanes ovalisporus]MBM2620641.1 hypothetical protein [Actinoplanes ovalisporus]